MSRNCGGIGAATVDAAGGADVEGAVVAGVGVDALGGGACVAQAVSATSGMSNAARNLIGPEGNAIFR
jgi:hypothetical protein